MNREIWPSLRGGRSARCGFVATLNGPSYAFDANGTVNCAGSPSVCTPLWIASGTTSSYASPAILEDRVFFTTPTKVLVYDKDGVQGCAVTPPNPTKVCTPLWGTAQVFGQFGSIYFSSPITANGVLYVGAMDGKVYAYDAKGLQSCAGTPIVCQPLWSHAISVDGFSSSPSVAGGRLYIGSSDSKLWTFER